MNRKKQKNKKQGIKSKPKAVRDGKVKKPKKELYAPYALGRHVIDSYLDERDDLLKKGGKVSNKKADEIEKHIRHTIKHYFWVYPVDFVIETYTRFGAAPQLVYDDNGLFAVSSAGLFPVVYGKQKINGTLFVKVNKAMWKPTIREALKFWIDKH